MSLENPDLPEEVPCEVCGKAVRNEDETPGLVINYWGLVAPWSHSYGFCAEHVPNDIEAVKHRIKQGLDPLPK